MTANAVALFAVDVSGSHELRVMDEAGNTTTLSPHNFSLFTPDADALLPWSYASENKKKNLAINVDMYGAVRAVEALTGEQFIFAKKLDSDEIVDRKTEVEKEAKDVRKGLAKLMKDEGDWLGSETNGIETKDRATGETYCIGVENGMLSPKKGACGTVAVTASVIDSVVASTVSSAAASTESTPAATESATTPSSTESIAVESVDTHSSTESVITEPTSTESVATPSSTEPEVAVSVTEEAIAEIAPAPQAEESISEDTALSATVSRLLANRPFGNGMGPLLYSFAPIRATVDFFGGFGQYVVNGFRLTPAVR